jgi:hypothetical protein
MIQNWMIVLPICLVLMFVILLGIRFAQQKKA